MASTGGRQGPREQRWSAHRGWSLAVRSLVALVPVLAGLLVGERLARALGPPSGWPATAVWWLLVLGATVATVLLVEHAARRLLPLSLLLRLSLLFPDQAPNRFRVALRASSVRRAERALAATGEDASASSQAAAGLALVAALHAHDRRTRGHSERVRALTVLVGRELGLGQDELDRLEWAGLLHDIGKLTVPSAILNKAGPPDDAEWSVLRRHPGEGGALMAPLAGWLGEWVHGVDQHHEDWDGTGYPLGLAGDSIALSGRIVAVTDALETMTASRAYKRRMPVAQARAELVACAGAQFDPAVVRAVLAVSLPRLALVLGPLAAALEVPVVAPVARSVVDLQGALATVTATTPRALATAALVLGTLGGGPTATVAGADTEVTGIAMGDHAPTPAAARSQSDAAVGESVRSPADADDTSAAARATTGDPTDGSRRDGTTPGFGPSAPRTGPPPSTPTQPATSPAHGPGVPPGPPPVTPTTTSPPTTPPPTTDPPPPPPPPPPVTDAPHPDPPGLPAAALACMDGGWLGLGFPNQGQCISAALHGG